MFESPELKVTLATPGLDNKLVKLPTLLIRPRMEIEFAFPIACPVWLPDSEGTLLGGVGEAGREAEVFCG